MIGRLLCVFVFGRCAWIHMLNTERHGLYWCRRCGDWSPGAPWVYGQHEPRSLSYRRPRQEDQQA
jgi:hypothetical protein